jgi:hypothetical protein
MNETYQQPGRWHELVLTPPQARSDSAHHSMVNIVNEQNNEWMSEMSSHPLNSALLVA